jgi:4-methyl-5(b-hydroxyethyl)-thiazole monophosphate biosynthesis
MEPTQTALIPVAQGNEDIEVIVLIDVLRRGGLQVVVASLDDQEVVTLMKGTRLVVDAAFHSVIDQPWDVIALPGGIPGAMNLAESSPLRERLQRQHLSGGVVAGICLAPALVLKPAGVLEAMDTVTGNPLAIRTPQQSWLPDHFTKLLGSNFDPKARVISDQKQRIVLSQTPGTAIEFAIAIVRMLCGEDAALAIENCFLVR